MRRRVRLSALQRRADRGRERDRHPAHAAGRLLPRAAASACEPNDAQRRFSDGDAARWAERVSEIKGAKVGAAIHSVRAVPKDQIPTVVEFAQGRPLHFHVSEQRAENEACLEAHGCTPVELLAELGALGPDSTAVHATHLTESDERLLHETTICMCPTTERDLADGIGRAGPKPQPRQRQPRGDRPVRGGPRRRARTCGSRPSGAATSAPRPCCAAPRTTRASAGPTPAGSSPARSPTSSRSASTRRAWRRRSPRRCSNRSCSRPPPRTSAA